MIKSLLIIVALLTSVPAVAVEECNSLSCVDKAFIKENRDAYYDILDRSLLAAKGCKHIQEILEFSPTIRGSVGSEEIISEFIEHEFMSNPSCVLGALEKSSPSAQAMVSHFLAFPTYVEGKLIKAKLDELKGEYPKAVSLVLSGP